MASTTTYTRRETATVSLYVLSVYNFLVALVAGLLVVGGAIQGGPVPGLFGFAAGFFLAIAGVTDYVSP